MKFWAFSIFWSHFGAFKVSPNTFALFLKLSRCWIFFSNFSALRKLWGSKFEPPTTELYFFHNFLIQKFKRFNSKILQNAINFDLPYLLQNEFMPNQRISSEKVHKSFSKKTLPVITNWPNSFSHI